MPIPTLPVTCMPSAAPVSILNLSATLEPLYVLITSEFVIPLSPSNLILAAWAPPDPCHSNPGDSSLSLLRKLIIGSAFKRDAWNRQIDRQYVRDTDKFL